MKKLLFLFALSNLTICFASQGKGGGDGVALLMSAKMRQALGTIKKIQGMPKHKYKKIQGLDIKLIEDIVENKKVMAVNEKLYTILNGEKYEVTALSDPKTLITKVNIKRFINTRELLGREGLGFHELMVLAQVETSGMYDSTDEYVLFMDKYMKNGYYCVSEKNPNFECTKSATSNKGYPWTCTDDGYKTTFKGTQGTGSIKKRGEVTHYSGGNRKMSWLAQEKSGVLTGMMTVYYSRKERRESDKPKKIDYDIYCLKY